MTLLFSGSKPPQDRLLAEQHTLAKPYLLVCIDQQRGLQLYTRSPTPRVPKSPVFVLWSAAFSLKVCTNRTIFHTIVGGSPIRWVFSLLAYTFWQPGRVAN